MSDKKIIHLVVGPIATNCWIYSYGSAEAAIIDPGDEADEIIAALEKAALTPMYILLTHGHFDHICAVPQLKAKYPDVKIAIHSNDSEYLGKESRKIHEQSIKFAIGSASFMDFLSSDIPDADILLEEGAGIGPFTVLHVPGHTQGCAAFWDKENDVLFAGDTLFNRGIGRTDLPGGSNKQIMESLKRLFAMDADIMVFPGHGETTTIGQESK